MSTMPPTCAVKPLLSPKASAILACALTSVFAVADFTVPGEVNVAILYGLSVGTCAWSLSPRFLWAVAGLCVFLTFAGQAFGPPPITRDEILGLLWADRAIVGVGLIALAAFVHLWILRTKRLAAAQALLRRQNEALVESESWLHATFEQDMVGIAHVDLTGRVLRVNKRFCELGGYAQADMLRLTYGDVVHPDDRQAGTAQMRELLIDATRACMLEERYVGQDGISRWVNVARTLARDTDDAPAYFIFIVEDITGRKRAEQDLLDLKDSLEARVTARTSELLASNDKLEQTEAVLRQSQKMEAIGQLTGGISHDFNNILTAIVGNLEIIASEAGDPSRHRRLARSALEAAETAARLVQHLLAFSRRQKLEPQAVSIEDVVDAARPLWQGALGAAITLSLDIPGDTWGCQVDRAQLEAALLNLVVNARDAMAGSGRVTISAHNTTAGPGSIADLPAGDFVLLSVSDTGPGMPASIRQKVFEPFFTTKEVGKGSGLGLPMVHGFVKQSGGDVLIESELGAGTTVLLYLPRVDPDGIPDPSGREVPRNGLAPLSETVLIVENEEPIRQVASEALGDAGYQVLLAGNAEQALAIAKDMHRVDLVLSDVVMPDGMSGYELAERLQQLDYAPPILLMTGYVPTPSERPLDEGRFEMLRKPFRPTELCARVRQMLERQPY